MTNSQKIRAMTDEELADMISNDRPKMSAYCPIIQADQNPGFCDDKCKDCVMDWLKQEVEE